jgi:uncharacterized protein YciI
MKITLFLCFNILIYGALFSQVSNPQYNAALADSLGADEYGMKSYTLVILKTGSYVEPDAEKRNALFRGHLDNIGRLVKGGKMVIAGPLGKNDLTYRGIFVLNTADLEEAKALLETDPAISAGIFDYEVMTWYGSAAIPAYIETHKTIEKKQP